MGFVRAFFWCNITRPHWNDTGRTAGLRLRFRCARGARVRQIRKFIARVISGVHITPVEPSMAVNHRGPGADRNVPRTARNACQKFRKWPRPDLSAPPSLIYGLILCRLFGERAARTGGPAAGAHNAQTFIIRGPYSLHFISVPVVGHKYVTRSNARCCEKRTGRGGGSEPSMLICCSGEEADAGLLNFFAMLFIAPEEGWVVAPPVIDLNAYTVSIELRTLPTPPDMFLSQNRALLNMFIPSPGTYWRLNLRGWFCASKRNQLTHNVVNITNTQ